MASIRVRQRADGSYSYTAIIRRRTHEEAETFSSRQAAASWADNRAKELDDPLLHIRARPGEPTLANWMEYHSAHHAHHAEWQRNKTTPLDYLQKLPITQVNPFKLTSSALVHHVKSRREKGIAANTVNNDLIWIQRVLRQRSSLKFVNQPQIDPEIVSEARRESRNLNLIG